MESTDEDLKKLAAEAANGRLKGLTDEAERGARDIHVADHMPIKRFFYAAKTILQQARTLAGEQDLERAYVLLIRFSTLFVEVLPTHAGFKSAEVAADRKALIKEVSKVLEEAELVKNVLRSRYLVDDEARIRAEVELQQQAAAEAKAKAEAQAAAKAAAEAAAANAARAAAAAAEARRAAEAEAKAKAKAAAEAAEVAAALAAVEEFEKREHSASRANALLAQARAAEAKAAEAAAAERAAAEVAGTKAAACASWSESAWSAPVCGACEDGSDTYLSLPQPAYPEKLSAASGSGGDYDGGGGGAASAMSMEAAAAAAAEAYAPRWAGAPPVVPPSQPVAAAPRAPLGQPVEPPPYRVPTYPSTYPPPMTAAASAPAVGASLPIGTSLPAVGATDARSASRPSAATDDGLGPLPKDLISLSLQTKLPCAYSGGSYSGGSAPSFAVLPPTVQQSTCTVPPVTRPSAPLAPGAVPGTVPLAGGASSFSARDGASPFSARDGASPFSGTGSCAPPPFSWDPTRTTTPPGHVGAHLGASGRALGNTTANLRPLLIPEALISTFERLAASNTARNIETCGILVGTVVNGELRTDRLLMPSQTGTRARAPPRTRIRSDCLSHQL